MPLYEYECDACSHRFEVIQKFSDGPVETCASCGKGPVRRLLSSPAIQFKGSGWYITDYAQKGKSSDASGGSAKSDASEKGEKADKTDAKAEKKIDSPAASSTPSPAKT
jgi:putative FmdB family regulatory protein